MLKVQEHHWCSLQACITLHHQSQSGHPDATRFRQTALCQRSSHFKSCMGWIQHPYRCNAFPMLRQHVMQAPVCRPDALHWHHYTVLAAPEAHHKQASRHTTLNQASRHTTPNQASKQAHNIQPSKQADTQHLGKQAGKQQVGKQARQTAGRQVT